jgi:UPF0755 protein
MKWLAAVAVVLMIAAGTVVYGLTRPVSVTAGESILVQVKPGMAAQAIGEMLYDKGLVKSVLLFRVVAKLQGAENSLQAGEYALRPNLTVQQIIGIMARGETAYKQFTIPEGYTVDQIAAHLAEKKLASAEKFKALAQNYTPYGYMNTTAAVTYKAEGYVFPDTYRIAAGTNEEQLLKMMVAQFDEQFTPAMRQRATELGLSPREVVILASLVEKEARIDRERPIIAGIFLHRLQLAMPLQSCATIQYILGYPKPELTVADTEIPSPFNTYLHPGLPPGPIANPGLAALKAVLYPAQTDYLYFVVDKNGAHRFSRTYSEHLAAIEQVSN